METLPSAHGPVPTYVARPAGDGPWPGVVVLHDAGGMSHDVRDHAQWLADHGYLAAAPDLYRGGAPVRCMIRMMRNLIAGREEEPMSGIEAARQYLLAHEECSGRVGVVGFCMGGGFALMLAPRGLYDAAAPSYGAVDDALLDKMATACPVVASYGRRDRSLRGTAAQLEAALSRHGVPHDVKEYSEAGHGFMNDHSKDRLPLLFRFLGALVYTRFDPEATADARRRILAFFAEHLGDPAPSRA